MQRKLITLICLTLGVFLVLQGMRLLSDEGWSWIASAGYGTALAFQVFALWETRNPARP